MFKKLFSEECVDQSKLTSTVGDWIVGLEMAVDYYNYKDPHNYKKLTRLDINDGIEEFLLVDPFRYTHPDEIRHNAKHYWTYESKI